MRKCIGLAPLVILIGALCWAIASATMGAIDSKAQRLAEKKAHERHIYCEALWAQGKRAKFNQKGCKRDSSVDR